MANTLMFEVGIKSAQEQLEKIKQEFTKANGELSKLLNIKVSIDGLDAVTKALSQIGDTSALRNLRNEVAALNREFSILSKGAGGTGDIASRGIAADIEKTTQNIERYTNKIKQLTEERGRLVGGTRNSNYQNMTDEILRYTTQLEGARSKLARLNEDQKKLADGKTFDKPIEGALNLETAVTRVETAINGLKSGMNVNLSGDFSKWAQEVQNVTASVRELVEQLQKMNNAAKISANVSNESLLAQAKTVDDLRTKYNKMLHDGLTIPKSAASYTAIENLPNVEKQLAAEQTRFNEMLIRGASVAGSFAEAIQQLGQKYSFTAEQAQKLAAIIASGDVSRGNVQRRLGVGYEKAGDIVETINALQKLKQEESKPAPQGGLFDSQKFKTLQEAIDKIISEINRLQQAFTHLGENGSLSNLSTMINGLAVTLSSLGNAIKIQPVDDQVKTLLERCERAETKLREVGDAARYLNEQAGAKTQQKASNIMGIAGIEEEQLNKVSSTAERFQRLLVEIENQMAKIGQIQAFGAESNILKNAWEQFDALKKMVDATINGKPIAENLIIPASDSQLAQFIQQFGLLKAEYRDIIKEADRFNKVTSKEAVDGAKNAERENKRWADSMDYAKVKANELKMTIEKMENVVKSAKPGVDTTALQHSIELMKQNLQTLYGMMGGAKIGGTAQEFVSSSAFKLPIDDAKHYAQAINQAKSSVFQLTESEQQLANAIKGSTDHMRGQSQVLSDLKMMATQYLGVWGAQGFLKNVIEIGGQLEMQRLSIGAILGDMAKATELFDRIKNLAIKSPFGVVELDQMTKQLSAYGFEYNELFDMTKRLADISAATGTGVDRLALALGHVRSEAALSGYTLRQFSMANIPLAKKLSEELTKVEGKFVSVADVRKRVRTKDIGYEQVLKVLKDLTDEGGMFYNAQEIMSESVKARFKNLKDSMDIMYGEIAESSVGKGLKEVASLLTTLTRHWQELGSVLVVGASYWAINRIAMMAASKAMVQGNLTLGRFSASQLEMQATTGNLTRAQLLQAVATKKLAVADAEAAAAVLGLSRAQLQHVANTGKVTSAMNMATIATSKYTMSQLRMIATWKRFNFGWLATGLVGITTGAKAAAVAIGGLFRAMWPMLAISAIVEVFMSMKREAEQFADAANYVGQAARNMMKDIDDAINSVSKNGKPVDTEALREAVNTMKEVVENSEFYTAEQQKQVENAKTLSEKYDVLLRQMKEMKEEAEWQTNNEGLIEKILANTGRNVKVNTAQNWNGQLGKYETVTSQTFGSRFFNDSLQENIEQVNKSNASLQSAINLLSEYQNVIEDAIKKNNNFGLSLDGKTWQEKVRLIAESGQWDRFVASVENAGSRFENTASKVKKASEKVRDDWEEIVNDDVKSIRLTLMQEWGMTEDEINQFAKNNERTMRWLVDSIAKSLSKLGVAEQIIDEFKRKLLELFGVASSGKPVKRELTEYEKQTDLGKRVLANVIRHNKNNGKGGQGVTTVKEINEIVGTGENVKTESEVVKALKERAQKDHEAMKDIGRIYGETSTQYAKAKKKYEHSLNLAESNNIKESDILTGKYKDKGSNKSDEDKYAKVLRERVRILKEAADSYQYWREKVGETGAERRMQGEFGQLLTEQNLQLKNSDELRAKLKALREEYSKKPQTKAMVEAIKEIDKEIANLDRKDFERDTEKFLSETEIKLDALTRAWDKFNTVRNATGNVELAINIAGVKYQEGQRTLADAVRQSVEDDFKSFGVQAIPFSVELDKESIKRQIQEAFAAVAPIKPVQGKDESAEDFKQRMDAYNAALATHEARIKGVVTEYEKWQELQKQIEQADLQVYANLTGSAVDLTTELQKINDEYLKQLDSLNRLKSKGVIKQDQYNQSRSILDANTNMKLVQAKESYKLLVDGVITMNKNAARIIKNEYADALEQQLKVGAITAKDYADKIDEINKKMNDLENSPSNFKSFMEGGLSGLIQNLSNRGKSMTEQGASLFQQGFSEKDEKGMSNFKKMFQGQDMMKMGKNMSAMSQGMSSTANTIGIIIKALDDFAKGLRETFETMRELAESAGSDTHTSSWNTWDTMTSGFSRTTGNISKAWNGIQSGDIGAVLSGAVGTFVSPLIEYNKGHDRLLSYRIEDLTKEVKVIESDLAMIKRFRERNLGYDTGEARKLMSEFSKHFASYTKKENLEGDVATYYYGVLPYNMANYYNYDEKMNGYMQELEDLRSKRDKIAQQYSNELDKKNSSDEALREYQDQISELDEQIMYFTQDLSKELWDIDFKSWATQFSDALWTAFENGEDAAQAFHDTAEDIIADVAKRMMTLSILEPMFNRLQKELFGEYDADLNRYVGGKIKYDTNGNIDMEGSQQDVLSVLGKYFGEGGEAEKSAEAANMFYDWVKEITGFELNGSDSSSSSMSNTIKGVTEQTEDLIASYLNACRADLSVNRAMIAQYFPMFYQALTSQNGSLVNIENHTAAIMRSNDAIERSNQAILDSINGLKNKAWKVPIA